MLDASQSRSAGWATSACVANRLYARTAASSESRVKRGMAPLFAERDLSTVRELLIGGAPVPRELIRRYRLAQDKPRSFSMRRHGVTPV